MLIAAEELNFELAANLRDRLNAVEALSQKQLVTAGALADTDVVGYGETEAKACFAVLHFSGGNLLDKEFQVFQLAEFIAKGDAKNAIDLVDSFMVKAGQGFTVLMPLYNTYRRALADYADAERWSRMSLMNTATSGVFASDNSINKYADEIWHATPINKIKI